MLAEVASFEGFEHVVGRAFVQYLVTVFAGSIETAVLIPVVRSLDNGVLVLSVVSALVLYVVELGSTAFGAGIGHPVPVVSFDVLNLQ